MLTLPPSVRIYVALRPIDMRAQFDGLAGAARQHIGGDPLGRRGVLALALAGEGGERADENEEQGGPVMA